MWVQPFLSVVPKCSNIGQRLTSWMCIRVTLISISQFTPRPVTYILELSCKLSLCTHKIMCLRSELYINFWTSQGTIIIGFTKSLFPLSFHWHCLDKCQWMTMFKEMAHAYKFWVNTGIYFMNSKYLIQGIEHSLMIECPNHISIRQTIFSWIELSLHPLLEWGDKDTRYQSSRSGQSGWTKSKSYLPNNLRTQHTSLSNFACRAQYYFAALKQTTSSERYHPGRMPSSQWVL